MSIPKACPVFHFTLHVEHNLLFAWAPDFRPSCMNDIGCLLVQVHGMKEEMGGKNHTQSTVKGLVGLVPTPGPIIPILTWSNRIKKHLSTVPKCHLADLAGHTSQHEDENRASILNNFISFFFGILETVGNNP